MLPICSHPVCLAPSPFPRFVEALSASALGYWQRGDLSPVNSLSPITPPMSQTPRTSLACAHTVALQAKRLAAGAWEAKGARMHEYVTRRHHVRTTQIRTVDPGSCYGGRGKRPCFAHVLSFSSFSWIREDARVRSKTVVPCCCSLLRPLSILPRDASPSRSTAVSTAV
jgi:hypothetical protein